MKNYCVVPLLIIFISSALVSCSISNKTSPSKQLYNQPGTLFHRILVPLDNQATEAKVAALKNHSFGRVKTSNLVAKHANSIVELYEAGLLENYKTNDYVNADKVFKSKPDLLELLIQLFPIDSYALLRKVQSVENLDQDLILTAIVSMNLDPTLVFDESASGLENSVTPLINSAGIVLYNQNEDSTNTVRFKKLNELQWRDGLSLVWEPVYGALSGSLVYLDEDTEYEVEIMVKSESDEQLYSFTFKTRANSPPIDPNKVYYLSEIYNGGQLNLEELDIYGSEDGYAKIIGDGTIIDAGDEFLSAVHIGRQSYVMLENFIIKGGKRYGIFADRTHNIWIKGCDVSEYGRKAGVYKNGKAYESENSSSPINYDSGIYLQKTGVSVIENCEIHNQNLSANHWGNGHPNGPSAILVWAYHPDEALRGQMIVRSNRLYGSDTNRFNDVIEGRQNSWRNGGFVRDSAIYGNYLAFANDDLVELDGGQRNVLFYNNELTQGYTGISVAPNRLGPNYIFHNYIHDLGDERGSEWTAIKAGGLMSQPAGQNLILENYIYTNRNGLAASNFNGDNTFWVHMQNNITITKNIGNASGFCIYDEQKYYKSRSINDLCFNESIVDARYEFNLDDIVENELSDDETYIEMLKDNRPTLLESSPTSLIPNFSNQTSTEPIQFSMSPKELENKTWLLDTKELKFTSFSQQYEYGQTFKETRHTLTLTGNNWIKAPIHYEITEKTELKLTLEIVGVPEIVGIGFETDNKQNANRIIQFFGTQSWGVDAQGFFNAPATEITFPIGKYIQGHVKYIVFVLDYDDVKKSQNNASVTFSDIKLTISN